MKPLLVVLLIIGLIYYDFWEDINNKDSGNWKQMTLYSVQLEGEEWKKLDVRLPADVDGHLDFIKYEVPIPHRYSLERLAYIIDVEVNPSGHNGLVSLQMLTTKKSDGRFLRVESSWSGNCGIVGNTSKTGSWDTKLDKIQSMGHPYFTNPKAVGFLWYPGTGYCAKDAPQTAEHASSFPIILKIYDGSELIGEEQINFEIFKNGIWKYILMP